MHILVSYDFSDDTRELKLMAQSYDIYHISALLYPENDQRESEFALSGRVPWEIAIQSTFGSAGSRLLGCCRLLSQALGIGARQIHEVQEMTKDAEVEDDNARIQSQRLYREERGYGRSFVQYMVSRLPELTTLDHSAIEDCLMMSEAQSCFTKTIHQLVVVCGCTRCSLSTVGEHLPLRLGEFCLPYLAQYILVMTYDLSFVHVEGNLQPLRVRLERLYEIYETASEA